MPRWCVGTGTILASMIYPLRAMRTMLVKTLKQLFDRQRNSRDGNDQLRAGRTPAGRCALD